MKLFLLKNEKNIHILLLHRFFFVYLQQKFQSLKNWGGTIIR